MGGSQMRKFRLLKDGALGKAGDIFSPKPESGLLGWYFSESGTPVHFSKIDGTPDLFEEVRGGVPRGDFLGAEDPLDAISGLPPHDWLKSAAGRAYARKDEAMRKLAELVFDGECEPCLTPADVARLPAFLRDRQGKSDNRLA